MCLEIHRILNLYATEYYSLLAKGQVVHFKRSEAAITSFGLECAPESH
jgi:hypothetical protein